MDLCFRFVNDFGRSTVDCWCGQLYSSHWGLWLGRRSMLTRRRCRISGYLICIHPNGVVHAIKNIFATTATPSSGFQVLLETVQDLTDTCCGTWASFQKDINCHMESFVDVHPFQPFRPGQSIYFFIKNGYKNIWILLMEEILHQFEVGTLSRYLQGFIDSRWLFGISEPSTVSFIIIFPQGLITIKRCSETIASKCCFFERLFSFFQMWLETT